MEYKFEMGQGKLRVVVPKELDHHLATQLKEEAGPFDRDLSCEDPDL